MKEGGVGGASGRDGRSERWRDHREVRRAELIDAVIAAVTAQGPAIGMDDIARASGIAKPVYYRYFRSKSDLFLEVGRTVGQMVVDETAAAINAATTPRTMLAAGIDAYLKGIEARPDVYRFVVQHRDLGDYASVVGLQASAVIGAFMRQAGVDSGGAELWGFGIVGLVRAAADRWLEQKTMSREDVVTYLTDLVWPGLAGPPPAGRG